MPVPSGKQGHSPQELRHMGLFVDYDAGMLDERDKAIVVALQENGRATFAEVAHAVGLAPSSVHERIRKLEQAGVIKRYRAEIDAEALGLFVTALVSVSPL